MPSVDKDGIRDKYDVIVLGTGLVECVVSGLLSAHGYSVLHADTNTYYGGESASLNLQELFNKFDKTEDLQKAEERLGRPMKYNVDLIPKVLMSADLLCDILRSTIVERYDMEFVPLDGSYVMQHGKIRKVPVTPGEAFSSKLMGFFEKRRAASFFRFVASVDPDSPPSKPKYDLRHVTAREFMKSFGLSTDTQTFVTHAIALFADDSHLNEPALELVLRAKVYANSLALYDGAYSPYIYPLYGNGEISQAFARYCAVHGGTHMLGAKVTDIQFNSKGEFESLSITPPPMGKCESSETSARTVRARAVLSSPFYFPDHVVSLRKVVRCIALLDHPIELPGTSPKNSLQIIIPSVEANRHSDIYVLQLSSDNEVCPPGIFVAIVGTVVENLGNPDADLQPGLQLLGDRLETFVQISTVFMPKDDGLKSRCFVTQSYDEATHFGTSAEDVLSLFQRIHGAPFNPSKMNQNPSCS